MGCCDCAGTSTGSCVITVIKSRAFRLINLHARIWETKLLRSFRLVPAYVS